jgi:hypothetical protein
MNTPGKHRQSVNPQPGMSNPSTSDWKGGLGVDKALQLIEAHPLMVWGGILASILLIILIATTSLLSPIASNERSVSGVALGSSTTQTAPTKHRNRIPLWLFGAIALTCTAGSIVVSKHLAPVERTYRRPKRMAPQAAKRRAAKRSRAPIAPPSRQSCRQTSRPPMAKSLPPQAVKVPITVVPSEANHPLDWQDESLADVMDLRRQRSLSSWMEER